MHRTMQRKNKQQNRITHIINNNNLMWLKWDHPQHHQQQSSRRLDQVVYEDLEGNHNGNEVRSGRESENKEIGAIQKSVKEAREKQSGSPSNLSNTLGMLFQEERKKVCTFSLCNQRAPPAPVQIAAAESYAPANKGRAFSGRSWAGKVYTFWRWWARGWSWVLEFDTERDIFDPFGRSPAFQLYTSAFSLFSMANIKV